MKGNTMAKNVVITGAGGALGRLVVKRFLDDGARVAAAVRDLKKWSEGDGRAARVFSADLTREDQVDRLMEEIVSALGSIDVLINAAGGYSGGVPVAETSAEQWDRMMALNLRSVFLCCRAAMRHMSRDGGGVILTVSAMAALSPGPNRAAYLVSKAGVIALTRALAAEGKNAGVRVNSVAPSIIRTEANLAAMPDMDAAKWVDPVRIAETLLFLCRDEAADITGSIIEMPGRL